jgi:hypothetical protein
MIVAGRTYRLKVSVCFIVDVNFESFISSMKFLSPIKLELLLERFWSVKEENNEESIGYQNIIE